MSGGVAVLAGNAVALAGDRISARAEDASTATRGSLGVGVLVVTPSIAECPVSSDDAVAVDELAVPLALLAAVEAAVPDSALMSNAACVDGVSAVVNAKEDMPLSAMLGALSDAALHDDAVLEPAPNPLALNGISELPKLNEPKFNCDDDGLANGGVESVPLDED